MSEEPTNLEAEAPEGVDTANAADAPELETDLPEGDEPPEGEDDSEEVDLDGQKYRVPKALKPALMMHADYTRKTQTLAEQTRALEAERQSVIQQAEAKSAFVEDHAQVLSLKGQVDAYKAVDWNALAAQDPTYAQTAWMQYQAVKDQLGDAEKALQGKMQQRALDEQSSLTRRIQEGYAKLPEVIPGWNSDLEVKVATFARSQGVSQEELRNATANPRDVKLLHLAMIGADSLKQQKTAAKLEKAQSVQPAKTVGARTAPPTGLDDRLSTEEWTRRRNAQLAARR